MSSAGPSSGPSSTKASTPSLKSVLFARGILARLSTWPALRLAIAESWGGPQSSQKRSWLASVILDAFEDDSQPTPDAIYVEEMLLQVMEDEFDCVLEDGSAEGVAKDIVKVWDQLGFGGGEEMVKKLEGEAEKTKGKKIEVEEGVASDDEDWEDDESGEDEDEVPMLIDDGKPVATRPPKAEPEIDEDGFTMVKRKGR
ncbi:hypothetical protein JAAARDRAFT_28807 [Jaapia argillacea MUCL 33604]|uniref:Pre-rRNA-processing protein TSR2 n=1 Tax=Jaapia argillacea MUCL 33604 TaxID=933084 RepID=A0A067QR31_9AGAM|nr:hypothetical protein JAAARDRAFT_28807 [Jaapia argillacea MUCL 33604]